MMAALYIALAIGIVIGMAWLAFRVAKARELRREPTYPMFRLAVRSGGGEVVTDGPRWSGVRAALHEIAPGTTVTLERKDSQEIVAEGAHARFTIRYKDGNGAERMVGRPTGGARRGLTELHADRALVTVFEFWDTTDGAEVFRTFLDQEPLTPRFTLRDTSRLLSRKEIQDLLQPAFA